MGMLFDPIAITTFYAALTIAACVIAWRSGVVSIRLIAAWMFIEWVGSNTIYEWVGSAGSPWITPTFDAVICVMVAGVAVAHRCRVAWEVVRLFVLEEMIVVGSFLTHQQGSDFYYLALNAVFVCQLWALGGRGIAELVRRARGGDRSPRYHVPRRA